MIGLRGFRAFRGFRVHSVWGYRFVSCMCR